MNDWMEGIPKDRVILKWCIVIGTIASLILSIITYLWHEAGGGRLDFLIFLSLPFFLVAGIIAGWHIKPKNAYQVAGIAVFMGIYEFIAYLFVYWIGIEIIIKRAWESPMFSHNWGFAIVYPMVFMVLSFIPMSILGGFIAYGGRKIIKRYRGG